MEKGPVFQSGRGGRRKGEEDGAGDCCRGRHTEFIGRKRVFGPGLSRRAESKAEQCIGQATLLVLVRASAATQSQSEDESRGSGCWDQ